MCFIKALGIEEEELKKRKKAVGEGDRHPGEHGTSLEIVLERGEQLCKIHQDSQRE